MQKIKYICDRCRTEQYQPFKCFIRTFEKAETENALMQYEPIKEDYELCKKCYKTIIKELENYDR